MGLYFWKKTPKWSPLGATEMYLMLSPVRKSERERNTTSKYLAVDLLNYDEEIAENFPVIAIEVMKSLLSGRQVLTFISDFSTQSYKVQKESFLSNYYYFLRAHNMADHVHYRAPVDMVTHTVGMNEAVAKLIFVQPRALCTYKAYGYASLQTISGVLEARTLVEQEGYSVCIECERYPDCLHIWINMDKISVEKLIEAARSACEMHGMKLKIDPKVLM